ncbi:class I SAM-dependent methyltransferase [Actinoplanes sp. NPDC051494]|uniref:class I SAM-dependent methyltransferase n=1 Tax=Actinoplanes sp. NPDC051494 TaxID=3363907 RepID=UPI0037AE0298
METAPPRCRRRSCPPRAGRPRIQGVTIVQKWLVRRARLGRNPTVDRWFRSLVDGTGGQVVEIGCGVGLLFRYYPPTVGRVIAIEPDRASRLQARSVAAGLPQPVEVVDGGAGGVLPIADDAADFVVCPAVLCSAADPAQMVREIDRILRTGGQLRVLEHTLSGNRVLAALQRLADRCGWPRFFGGCHVSRDTEARLAGAGFRWLEVEHGWFTRAPFMWPSGPHVRGTAVRARDTADR